MCGGVRRQTFRVLIDRTTGHAQRRPEEKRARLLAAARKAFATSGYGASVHDICQAAGVGIGTFYHQFPDKSDLMRFLMDEEHQYRVRGFEALGPDDLASEVVRVLAGSDPALLRAMIEACGIDERLLDFAQTLRQDSRERLVAALARARKARDVRRPALDTNIAAWAILLLGDAAKDRSGSDDVQKVVEVLAFAGADDVRRIRA